MAQMAMMPALAKMGPVLRLPAPAARAMAVSVAPCVRPRSVDMSVSDKSDEPAMKQKFQPRPKRKRAKMSKGIWVEMGVRMAEMAKMMAPIMIMGTRPNWVMSWPVTLERPYMPKVCAIMTQEMALALWA